MPVIFLHCSPYRIVDDCGGAFAMGAIGGGIFSFMKGWRNSPKVGKLQFCQQNYYFLNYSL